MFRRIIRVVSAITAALFFSLVPSFDSEAALKTMPDGGQFDPSFYAATYPDVFAAFGMNETLLYQHYLLCGIAERRLPYAGFSYATPPTGSAYGTIMTMPDGCLFDPVYYAYMNPDVVAIFGTHPANLYYHYLYAGAAEGRLPYDGAKPADVKLIFNTQYAIANVVSEADVVSAVRQAAMYRVDSLKIVTKWECKLSSDSITALVNAQGVFIKTVYGATVITQTPKLYGNADNLTIEVPVTIRF